MCLLCGPTEVPYRDLDGSRQAHVKDILRLGVEGEPLALFIPHDNPISVMVLGGERLLIRANLKEAKLHNGEIVEVAGFKRDGSLVLKDKRVIPPQIRRFTYGYATTSHASQGKSIDRGIVLMAADGIKAANLKQASVSHSRFEESHTTYTSDMTAAMKAMARLQDRELAIELADERIRRWKIFARLTQQAEVWAESRKQALATRQSQGSRIT